MRRVLPLALLLVAPRFALASTIVVPIDQPTIQAAIDAAGPSDVIEIRSGVYLEPVAIDGKGDLTLRGKGKVVLRSQLDGASITLASATNVHFEKLRFEGAGIGIDATNCAGLTVEGCRFTGLQTGIAADFPTGDTSVSGCTFLGLLGTAVDVFFQPDGAQFSFDGNHVRDARTACFIRAGRCTVTGNDLRHLAGDAIVLEDLQNDATEDSVVAGNRIVDVGGAGLLSEDSDLLTAALLVTDNDIRHAQLGGIVLGIVGSVELQDNRIRDTGLLGVRVQAAFGTVIILDNDLRKVPGDGLQTGGPGPFLVTGNSVTGCGHDGVLEFDDGVTYTGNKILGSDRRGLTLNGQGCTLSANTIKGSGGVDLHEEHPGTNDIQPDNQIGTTDS